MKKIYVFIVCTGIYNELWNTERILSLNNLFPGYKKDLIIISDKDSTERFKSYLLHDEYDDIKYYHICNLIYPFITMFKFNYIVDAANILNIDENDFFIYFDAHSYIIQKPKSDWENLYNNHLCKYDICYTTNPYISKRAHEQWDGYYHDIDRRSKFNVDEIAYKQNPDYWAQLSFLMGTISALHKFKNNIMELMFKDIQYTGDVEHKKAIIPDRNEQHYANYIFYNILVYNNDYGYTLHNDYYVNNAKRSNDNTNETFIYCHYKKDIVNDLKRNTTEYNENY